MNYKNVYTVCYNSLDVFKSKEAAKEFYNFCYYSSDGAEQARYASILIDLDYSNFGSDKKSSFCNKISINLDDKTQKIYVVNLKEELPVKETIKYYEEKIEPILEISKKYNINFKSKIPFEHFNSDEESIRHKSFSDYYREILEKLNVNVDYIFTSNLSDGKYTLNVNNEEFKVTAWDTLSLVIDNIDLMLEKFKTNENEMQL